jgi:hypothetical protein
MTRKELKRKLIQTGWAPKNILDPVVYKEGPIDKSVERSNTMKAIVKATGKKVSVIDWGSNLHPRYWDKSQGYNASELIFPDKAPCSCGGKCQKAASLTTPAATKLFLSGIDWALLRRQKAALVKLSNKDTVSKADQHNLAGIIHLLDGLQDFAVDEAGLPTQTVFNLTGEK